MAHPGFTRRGVLRAGAGVTAAALISSRATATLNRAYAAGLRAPGSLPDPSRPAGTPDAALPFDHVVVVMQENHSFDNYLGMLPRRGGQAVDGFRFDAAGVPVNATPYKDGVLAVQRAPSHCQPGGPGQNWRSTHAQIAGGRMDGFARDNPISMTYWDEADLPFYYSLAKTFTVGDRWFASAPCQTYPNRRFLLAGTAFGLISTDTSSITATPPNGTLFDRLGTHGITWRNYFSDVPGTGVIASVPAKHPLNLAPLAQFELDCRAGTLPAVSFVDSDIGVAGVVADPVLGPIKAPFAQQAKDSLDVLNADEENPSDISLGENFVSRIVSAVLASPSWARILLVWTYDEHGGYYDHVPPPAALPPDTIAPVLGPKDPPGGYDIYGPRVPAVVVSAHARPHAVTSVVHDHTSILATIQAKWNLEAMTFRDANATTLVDFLDLSGPPAFLEPPALAAPSDAAEAQRTCSLAEPQYVVRPAPATPAGNTGALVVRFFGRHGVAHGLAVTLRTRRGVARALTVELLRGGRVIAATHVAHVGTPLHRAVLRPSHGSAVAPGPATLVVRHGRTVVLRRRVRVR